ncbi:MAG TPA: LacI family DNA-binding transcriptional regulator [Candidatus Dormibacteraeota bacterium]|nr:LacI family DNA-binding transcriptional regulator [Candidatus Dormibacteraeota bacterium]
MPFVSLKDVAARAGVSFQTVSKVLKGSPVHVSEATRARVLEGARELGYVPNAVARGLATQSTSAIGIVAGDLADWSLSQFVVGAEREARRRGHAVLITSARGEPDDTAACVRALVERRVHGIVAAAPQLEHDRELARLLRDVPTVSIHHVPGGGVSLVGSDHRVSGRLAVEHLASLGHRRIATITGPPDRRVVSRLHGYREALAAAGIAPDPVLVEAADWTPEGGYQATLRLLDRAPDLTALFAQNDLMAMGALSALQRRGRAVPGDIAVVGCDDLPMVVHTVPALTTVHLPFTETGARAVSLLLEQIRKDGGPRPERVLLPVRLVVRGSCGGGSDDD